MINVKTLEFSGDGKTINIHIETGAAERFVDLFVSTDDTFEDTATALDISAKYELINNKEIIIITPEDLGLVEFEGLYFFTFTSNGEPSESTCFNCSGVERTEALLYTKDYEECLMKGTLEYFYDEKGRNTLLDVDLLLESAKTAVQNDWFAEAVKFKDMLNDYCNICVPCKELGRQNYNSFDNIKLDKGLKMT